MTGVQTCALPIYKQQQLELLGGSDATFQQRNRELGITDGELTRLEQELNQAKFELLQMESTVARLRTDCSGYEVDQKTSVHKHDLLAQDLAGVREQREAAARVAAECEARVEEALAAVEEARAARDTVRGQYAVGEQAQAVAIWSTRREGKPCMVCGQAAPGVDWAQRGASLGAIVERLGGSLDRAELAVQRAEEDQRRAEEAKRAHQTEAQRHDRNPPHSRNLRTPAMRPSPIMPDCPRRREGISLSASAQEIFHGEPRDAQDRENS